MWIFVKCRILYKNASKFKALRNKSINGKGYGYKFVRIWETVFLRIRKVAFVVRNGSAN